MPDYPSTRRDESVVDVVHGNRIADPYRWLEDTSSDETRAWIKLQNELTESVLATSPAREEIRRRLTEMWNFPRVGAPFERGGRWFQLRNSGLQPQFVLWTMDSPTDEGRVLLDPNTLADDGTTSLSEFAVSNDGELLAYATSAGGSDWMTWRVRHVESGDDLPDVLPWSKFSGAAWSPDAGSLYYAVLDEPDTGRELLEQTRVPRIVRHRLGAEPSDDDDDDDDVVFVAPGQPEWLPSVDATDDGRFIVVTVGRGTFPERQLHVLDTHDISAGLRSIVDDFTCQVELAGNLGTTLFLVTDHQAERRRIVALDVDRPQRQHWREIVPESSDTLLSAHLFGGKLVLHYLHDAHSLVRVCTVDGKSAGEIELPALVSVTELTGHADSDVMHLTVTSFVDAGSIWRHDFATGETRQVVAAKAPLDPDAFVTEQAFVTSPDGTHVPVFLVHRSDVKPTGDVPVLLYGYGGFNIPLTPTFSAARLLWAERGGLYAVANLRGGGEYGKAWYDAGRLASKQNVFDDFCAAAAWLGGDSGWSRPQLIAAHGGSNGGLLVGACLTQRPELFGAAAPAVGVLDMLRFHLFTIGWAWKSDYGDPDDPKDFARLLAYSPLHNVREGAAYPPTLILTGDHDDRVAPGHSLKFAATLQAAQAADAPVLVRVETSAGHGAGKPTQKVIDEGTDLLTFLEQFLRV